jgi:hypothetical protein
LTFHPAPDGRRQFHQQWYMTQLSNIFIIILAITIQSKDRVGMDRLHDYVANQGVGRWPEAGVLKKLSLAG